MSLSVSSTNYQPAFGSSKTLNKASTFAKKQFEHVFVQGSSWALSEAVTPSPNLESALFRKVVIDLGEVLAKFVVKNKPSHSAISEINIGNQCTNVFAYAVDGARALCEKLSQR